MSYEFFTVMLKRTDGEVYADLHKTNRRIYFSKQEAQLELANMGEVSIHFHVVGLVALTADEWKQHALADTDSEYTSERNE
jgi:hypothetical protein